MQAVVLAAGEGTRLRPFTLARPKVMIPIGNKPILEFVVEALVANGIKDIVMVVGYKKERIMSFFGDGSRFGAQITYIIQDKQLGTAHAMTYLKDKIKGRFLVLPGDNIIDKEMVASLLALKEGNSILVTESDEPSKYGVVSIQDERIRSLEEKPIDGAGNIISTGLYNFEPSMLGLIEQGVRNGKYGISDVLKSLLGQVEIKAIFGNGQWDDAVYPWDLIRLNEIALGGKGQAVQGIIEQGVILKGSVSIGRGTRIRSGTYIEGPVVIGEGCDIGPMTAIFPSTSIGEGVNIGPFTSLANSIIMSNVTIGSHVHISQSIIDDNVKIGPSFSISSGQATVKVEGKYHTVKKIGIMVGEETVIGSRVVASSGTVIGSFCSIGDGTTVSGNIENRSIVI
ncbi:MAG: NTP transferase domain-containing protein [Methanomassiliicoccales archaeon]|nr:MAG: NTP transferase domain-containing protein [Methanomassiliicoccales archaeon]